MRKCIRTYACILVYVSVDLDVDVCVYIRGVCIYLGICKFDMYIYWSI